MIIAAIRNFIKLESAGGFILFAAALAALLLANSPWRFYYQITFNNPSINFIINEGLMAVFFLLVSLEIKREWREGELRTKEKSLLPIIAAIGGMTLPALFYFMVAARHADILKGWAIPTATDIAFSLAVLSLLGKRVPASLKIFLTTLAIIDDLGAIIIIALFYTDHTQLLFLVASLLILLWLNFLNYRQSTAYWLYFISGLVLWFFVLKAGVHATIAGVLLGFSIPLPLLKKLEEILHPWVAYGILPLFAFANSGLVLDGLSGHAFLNPLTLGILAGLLLGKPLGVFGASSLAIKMGWAVSPRQASWRQLAGVALLCGIGFTMSLFIADLAFPAHTAYGAAMKLGVISGSTVAAILGYLVLRA